MIVDTQAN